MEKTRAYVSSTGMYFPEKRVTNDDFAKTMDTSDQWIRERTGIAERRFCAKGEVTSDMSARAAIECLEKAGVALLPGSSFGEFGEGYLRLSYAASIPDIEKGLARIRSVLQ